LNGDTKKSSVDELLDDVEQDMKPVSPIKSAYGPESSGTLPDVVGHPPETEDDEPSDE